MKNELLEKALIEKGEGEAFQSLNDGEKTLLRCYYQSKGEDNLSKALVINDIVWERTLEEFVKALEKYEVKEIVFASSWSSSIDTLMFLMENGYKVIKPVTYKEEEWLNKKHIERGILLTR